MNLTRKIFISIIALFGVCWLYKEIHWRIFDCSTIKVEVSSNLDLNKVKVIATHRMGDDTIFESSKQVSGNVSVHAEQPPFWEIVYSDTLYSRFPSGYFKDCREDFDYKFRFYSILDTLFCDYSRDNDPLEVVRLRFKTQRR